MQPYAKQEISVADSGAVRLAVLVMLLERECFDMQSAAPGISTERCPRTVSNPLSAGNLCPFLPHETTRQSPTGNMRAEQGNQFDNEHTKSILDPDTFSKLEKRLLPQALELHFCTMLSESWHYLEMIQATSASGNINAVRSNTHYLLGSVDLTGASASGKPRVKLIRLVDHHKASGNGSTRCKKI